ncbi:MAG: MMPL family transporter [Pseudomonas marincola]
MSLIAKIWMICFSILIVSAGISVYAGHTRLVSDLASLFPQSNMENLESIAAEQVSNKTSKQIVFLVSHAEPESLSKSVDDLKSGLTHINGITVVGRSNTYFSEIGKMHQPAIGALASYKDYRALKDGQSQELIERSLMALYAPASNVNSSLIARDPLGLYQEYLNDLASGSGATEAGYRTIVAEIDENLSVDEVKSTNLRVIDTLVQKFLNEHSDLKIEYGGAPYYSQKIAEISKSEAERITMLAVCGIVILLILIFRSIKPVFGALLITSVGVVVGASATVLFFGEIHLIAVAFGASLVGVVVDYAIHFYTARRLTETSKITADRIRAGLLYGTGTSLVGFLALAFSGVDILMQIAIYSAFGLIGAATCVLYLLPNLTGISETAGLTTKLPKLLKFHRNAMKKIGYPVVALFCLLMMGAIVLDYLNPIDDVRLLRVTTPEFSKFEAAVRDHSDASSSRMMLVKGDTIEQILQREEILQEFLWKYIQNNTISDLWRISKIIPSVKFQTEVAALSATILKSNEARPLMGILPQRDNTLELLAADTQMISSLPSAISGLSISKGGLNPRGHLVILQGADPDFDTALLTDQFPWVSAVDAAQKYTDSLKEFRIEATYSLLGGMAFLTLFFMWKKGVGVGIRIFTVPMFAALSSLVLAAAIGININFFAIMASFLVLALGADYSLFQFAADEDDKDPAYLAVTYSAMSTILVFGLLAFSKIPVLQTMGSVVVLGVIMAWLFSPISDVKPEGENL